MPTRDAAIPSTRRPPIEGPDRAEDEKPKSNIVSQAVEIGGGMVDDPMSGGRPGSFERMENAWLDSAGNMTPEAGSRLLRTQPDPIPPPPGSPEGTRPTPPGPPVAVDGNEQAPLRLYSRDASGNRTFSRQGPKPVDGMFSFEGALVCVVDGRLWYRFGRSGKFLPVPITKSADHGRLFPLAGKRFTRAVINNEAVVCSGAHAQPVRLHVPRRRTVQAHFLGLPRPNIRETTVGTIKQDGKKWGYYFMYVRPYGSSGANKVDLGPPSPRLDVVEKEHNSADVTEYRFVEQNIPSPLYGPLEMRIFRTASGGMSARRIVHEQRLFDVPANEDGTFDTDAARDRATVDGVAQDAIWYRRSPNADRVNVRLEYEDALGTEVSSRLGPAAAEGDRRILLTPVGGSPLPAALFFVPVGDDWTVALFLQTTKAAVPRVHLSTEPGGTGDPGFPEDWLSPRGYAEAAAAPSVDSTTVAKLAAGTEDVFSYVWTGIPDVGGLDSPILLSAYPKVSLSDSSDAKNFSGADFYYFGDAGTQGTFTKGSSVALGRGVTAFNTTASPRGRRVPVLSYDVSFLEQYTDLPENDWEQIEVKLDNAQVPAALIFGSRVAGQAGLESFDRTPAHRFSDSDFSYWGTRIVSYFNPDRRAHQQTGRLVSMDSAGFTRRIAVPSGTRGAALSRPPNEFFSNVSTGLRRNLAIYRGTAHKRGSLSFSFGWCGGIPHLAAIDLLVEGGLAGLSNRTGRYVVGRTPFGFPRLSRTSTFTGVDLKVSWTDSNRRVYSRTYGLRNIGAGDDDLQFGAFPCAIHGGRMRAPSGFTRYRYLAANPGFDGAPTGPYTGYGNEQMNNRHPLWELFTGERASPSGLTSISITGTTDFVGFIAPTILGRPRTLSDVLPHANVQLLATKDLGPLRMVIDGRTLTKDGTFSVLGRDADVAGVQAPASPVNEDTGRTPLDTANARVNGERAWVWDWRLDTLNYPNLPGGRMFPSVGDGRDTKRTIKITKGSGSTKNVEIDWVLDQLSRPPNPPDLRPPSLRMGARRVGPPDLAEGVYQDNVAVNTDGVLSGRDPLYTQVAGAKTNSSPPEARFCAATGNRVFLGAVRTPREAVENRVVWSNLQSGLSSPYGFDASQRLDLDRPVTALARTLNNLVVFTESSVHRMEDAGGGNLGVYGLEDTHGCPSPEGPVDTPAGLVYPAEAGVFILQGVSPIRLSDHIAKTWQNEIPDKSLIKTVHDPVLQRVHFLYSHTVPSLYDRAFVMDMRRTRLADGGGWFSTRRTRYYTSEEGASLGRAWAFHAGLVHSSNDLGQVREYDPELRTHEVVDRRGNVRLVPVIFSFVSGGLDCGNPGMVKASSRLSYNLNCHSPGAVEFELITDQAGKQPAGTYVAEESPIVGLDTPFLATAVAKQAPVLGLHKQGNIFQVGMRTGLCPRAEGSFRIPSFARNEMIVTLSRPLPPSFVLRGLEVVVSQVDNYDSYGWLTRPNPQRTIVGATLNSDRTEVTLAVDPAWGEVPVLPERDRAGWNRLGSASGHALLTCRLSPRFSLISVVLYGARTGVSMKMGNIGG